jgi:hypothetical protein
MKQVYDEEWCRKEKECQAVWREKNAPEAAVIGIVGYDYGKSGNNRQSEQPATNKEVSMALQPDARCEKTDEQKRKEKPAFQDAEAVGCAVKKETNEKSGDENAYANERQSRKTKGMITREKDTPQEYKHETE